MIARIIALLVIIGAVFFFVFRGGDETNPAGENTPPTEISETTPVSTPPVEEGKDSSSEGKAEVPVKISTPLTDVIMVEPEEIAERAPVAITETVKIYLYEWGIDASSLTVRPGTIAFEVENIGQFTHDFAIEGIQNFGKVRPGETRVFSTRLGGGKFRLYSPRDDEKGKYIRETFEVVQ